MGVVNVVNVVDSGRLAEVSSSGQVYADCQGRRLCRLWQVSGREHQHQHGRGFRPHGVESEG